MRRDIHYHHCRRCSVRTKCTGRLEDNYDGWPAVICSVFHVDGGIAPAFLCDDCAELVSVELAESELAVSEPEHP